MVKFFTCRRILMKCGTRVRLKPFNDQGEFELERARSKNNIAENAFALGHETNNKRPVSVISDLHRAFAC